MAEPKTDFLLNCNQYLSVKCQQRPPCGPQQCEGSRDSRDIDHGENITISDCPQSSACKQPKEGKCENGSGRNKWGRKDSAVVHVSVDERLRKPEWRDEMTADKALMKGEIL